MSQIDDAVTYLKAQDAPNYVVTAKIYNVQPIRDPMGESLIGTHFAGVLPLQSQHVQCVTSSQTRFTAKRVF